jgi:Tol biopolymer transport system component
MKVPGVILLVPLLVACHVLFPFDYAPDHVSDQGVGLDRPASVDLADIAVDLPPNPLDQEPTSADATCGTWGSFTTPHKLVIGGDTSVNDWAPALSMDELTLYFVSDRPWLEDLNIWVATRQSASSPFPAPVALTAVNTNGDEEAPEISSTGDELLLSSKAKLQRYIVSGGIYSLDNTVLAKLPADADGASLSSDGRTLYYHANCGGSTGCDLARAVRSSGGEFTPTGPLAALNSGEDDDSPSISGDDLELFFESKRDGLGLASSIYVARRPDSAAQFQFQGEVTELSSVGVQRGDPEISADGRTLYFFATDTVLAPADLWVATRSCIK